MSGIVALVYYLFLYSQIERGAAMNFAEIENMVSTIKKAKEVNDSILLDCSSASAIDKASRLSEIITDLQSYWMSIQSDYISLLNQKKELEKRLVNVNTVDNIDNCSYSC